MLVPVFTLKLHQKIYPRLVTVGRFDGIHPSIAAATTGGKIFIHRPHLRSRPDTGGRITEGTGGLDVDCVFLNIGQHITSLTAGALIEGGTDLLFVGTANNLLAYDVENNQDVFYKEVPDGVNAMCVGVTGRNVDTLVYVGGNCSIQGYNSIGEDVFWTVTGDNVLSLMIFDFDADGENELLVGSDDYDIRVFKEDQMISEISETDSVIGLCPVTDSKFGYALANGTVGVYDKLSRYWRIKSKNQSLALFCYDLDNDGIEELITGWSSGKLDARNSKTGEVVFKDTFSSPIAGIMAADYRLDGVDQLIVCSTDGEIRGYIPAVKEMRGQLMDVSPEQKLFQELSQKKLQLIEEIRNYEQNEKESTGSRNKTTIQPGIDSEDGSVGIIPANTQLNSSLSISLGDADIPTDPHVVMTISTTNGTFIHLVVVIAESLFEDGESLVVHPPENKRCDQIKIPLIPPRDMPIDLHIKIYVGHKYTQQYHVFEITRQLPR
ncbi:Bardet-Biedl syndrome 2 protein [Oopsacas minuta]|uniref:Bardet-Biedl syndrome 2 protein n=1 Tax=Oopsacas minuta TaxID=111878 RepID=A0AAV7KQL0_9METZ|nr:Bardet-Biedl syndrome 2 protein [Oopsacas minuta]